MTPLDGGEPSPKGLLWAGASGMLDAACEEGRSWSGGREGGANSRIRPRSPAVATKREPWGLLPGGRRGMWVGYRCSPKGKTLW